jgi:hypothetical protein
MLKAHGIYYFVPGMLKHFDTEAVIALAAPRPMLFMTGDQDGGSPIEGVKHLGEIVSQSLRAARRRRQGPLREHDLSRCRACVLARDVGEDGEVDGPGG